jgi:hypothetical protein
MRSMAPSLLTTQDFGADDLGSPLDDGSSLEDKGARE